jgi:hypothetical protein
MRTHLITKILVLLIFADLARADISPPPPAPNATDAPTDAQREQAIAHYTQKMKDANYPALFDKAAQEFNVPSDILKAVSFAETRWSQLQWPAGETTSPDTGMPHAYGIMSLWDNDYFGHTLQQAAQLIGQSPDTLKTDVFQNMRGGAALLRQLYDQTPKPAGATNESQIESWRAAIAKYTGIPQPELSQAHALRVYEYMARGYHQYGIEWNARPVNLGPMRAEVAALQAAAHGTSSVAESNTATAPATSQSSPSPLPTVVVTQAPTPAAHAYNSDNEKQRPRLFALMMLLIALAIWHLFFRKQKNPRK